MRLDSKGLQGAGAALLCWLGAACGEHAAGTNVVLHAASSGAEGTPVSFTTDLGFQVTLTRAFVTFSAVELERCTPPSVWRGLKSALYSEAHAHTPSTPTRLGDPTVVDLLEARSAPVRLGTLGPPPADYCIAKVTAGPADGHASGLPDLAQLLGSSVYFEGTFVGTGQAEAQSFTLRAEGSTSARPTFERGAVARPLSLTGQSTRADVLLSLPFLRWFDGVDLEGSPAEAQATQVLDQLTGSLAATVAPQDD